jgi:hypothetical protein
MIGPATDSAEANGHVTRPGRRAGGNGVAKSEFGQTGYGSLIRARTSSRAGPLRHRTAEAAAPGSSGCWAR